MPYYKIKAEVVVTYIYEVEADTVQEAIESVEDGEEHDCIEHDNTLPVATEYTIDGQMGWNVVTAELMRPA
jgi:hypothetical protein